MTLDSIADLDIPASCQTRFEIRSLLKRGGMGVICIAWDRTCAREVAIKFLRKEFVNHPESNSRLIREAMVMSRLRHPGVPSVYDIGVDSDGRSWYAMQWIDGCELSEEIDRMFAMRTRRFDRYCRPLRSLLRHLIDAARTLQWAHEAGFLHRDIKPANIFVSRHSETVVLDWGLAGHCELDGKVSPRSESDPPDETWRTADPLDVDVSAISVEENELETMATSPEMATQWELSTTTQPDASAQPDIGPQKHVTALEYNIQSDLTQHLNKLGTPAYMAPEMRSGRLNEIGKRTDVYLLGATMYQILTGNPPFRHGDRPLQSLRGELDRNLISRDLREICLKAMHPSAEQRYATASEFAEDLERFLADEQIIAAEETTLRWIGRIGRRRWRLALAASSLLIFATVLLAVISVATQRTQRLQAENDLLDARRDAVRLDLDNQRRQTEIANLYRDVNALDELLAEQPMGWSDTVVPQYQSLLARVATEPTLKPRIRGQALSMSLRHDIRELSPNSAENRSWPDFRPGCFAYHDPTGCLAIGESKAKLYTMLELSILDKETSCFHPIAASSIFSGVKQLFTNGKPPGYRALCFSPSGEQLFVGTRSGEIYCYQKSGTGQQATWETTAPPSLVLVGLGAVNAIAVSTDANFLFAASNDNWIHRVNLSEAEKSPCEFKPANQEFVQSRGLLSRLGTSIVSDIQLTDDQRLILSPHEGKLWEADSLADIEGPPFRGEILSLHPDQQTLLVTGQNQELNIVDITSGNLIAPLLGAVPLLGVNESHQAISPDGSWLVRSLQWKQGTQMEVYDLGRGRRMTNIPICVELDPKLILTHNGTTIWLAGKNPVRYEIQAFEQRATRTAALSRPIREFVSVGNSLIVATDSQTHMLTVDDPMNTVVKDSSFTRAASWRDQRGFNSQRRYALYDSHPTNTVRMYGAVDTAPGESAPDGVRAIKETGSADFSNSVEAIAYGDDEGLWCAVEGSKFDLYRLDLLSPAGAVIDTLEPNQEIDLNEVLSPTSLAVQGNLILVGLRTGAIDVFDIERGTQVGQIWSGVNARVQELRFRPPVASEAPIVACLVRDGTLNLFRIGPNHEAIRIPLGSNGDYPAVPVKTFQWIGSRWLVCGLLNGMIEIYEMAGPTPTLALSADFKKPCYGLDITESGLALHFEGERVIHVIPLDYLGKLTTMETSLAGGSQ